MDTSSLRIYSTNVKQVDIERVVPALIARRIYFAITPLPEDDFEISVKEENKNFLDSLACGIPTLEQAHLFKSAHEFVNSIMMTLTNSDR